MRHISDHISLALDIQCVMLLGGTQRRVKHSVLEIDTHNPRKRAWAIVFFQVDLGAPLAGPTLPPRRQSLSPRWALRRRRTGWGRKTRAREGLLVL